MSERRQKRWDKKHMIVLSTKLRRSTALAFRGLCYERGKTVNAILKEYVVDCVNNDRVPKQK